ncbi:MAG: hypothetical protein HYY48_04535 [Gammaproteobacteria bacterium]|nr:hypothetical protein [Gammaproteobacteria bacterium]
MAAVQGKWLPVRSTTFVSRTEWVRSEQRAAGRKACFMTQERLHCRNGDCEWRRECRRLVAAWKR